MNTVIRVSTMKAVCTQVPRMKSGPTRKNSTRITPSTPILVITPESTALAGAGATGWAVGSHACMGNMPAFTPKPTSMANTMARSRFSWPATFAASSTPPGVKLRLVP